MNPDELDALTAGRRVFDGIQNNVATWRKLSLDNPKLPKLLIRPGRMLHGLPPSKEMFMETIERELGL
jgi:hypothetical protein